jgi:hypothetical protein
MVPESERRLAQVAAVFGAQAEPEAEPAEPEPAKPAGSRRRLSVAGGTDAPG